MKKVIILSGIIATVAISTMAAISCLKAYIATFTLINCAAEGGQYTGPNYPFLLATSMLIISGMAGGVAISLVEKLMKGAK